LFIASIGGFENTTADCAAREGASSGFCNAQKELVNFFLDPTLGSDGLTNARRACRAGGLDALANGAACISGPSVDSNGDDCASISHGTCIAM
jgi:hypothetical protein